MAVQLSLIVSTLGRGAELNRLFDSLDAQTFRDFEVIVVDQNDDDRLAEIVARPRSFPLQRLHTPRQRGLSHGRNTGLPAARGEFVLFPDDDCWYPPTLFAAAVSQARRARLDLLCGRATDERGRNINGRFRNKAQRVSRGSVWTTQIEWMMLFRRSALEALGGFDENLGVGSQSPWQAAEGQDISLRALALGMRCAYDPELCGHHPEINVGRPDATVLAKAHGYALGMGFVLGRYRFGLLVIAYWMARAWFNAACWALKADFSRARYFMTIASGRFEGWHAGRAAGRRRGVTACEVAAVGP